MPIARRLAATIPFCSLPAAGPTRQRARAPVRAGRPANGLTRTRYARPTSASCSSAIATPAGTTCRLEIESRAWKFVVLQAQKISVSGRHEYSRAEGIEIARLAKARGATVVFYPEWCLKGKPGDGARQERVYREMADEAAAVVAPVAFAWDLALAERPELPLHADDGNHQSVLGAFLTAAVLCGRLTAESPATLANFPYPGASEHDRRFLAEIAAKAVARELEKR